MKKLSEKVSFLRSIQEMSLEDSREHLSSDLQDIFGKLQNFSGHSDDNLEDLANKILKDINTFDQKFNIYKDTVLDTIAEQEKTYFQKSYSLYEDMKNDSDEWILSRSNTLTVDNSNDYLAHVESYTSWKYPALYIRPGLDDYVKKMTACDPLYIVDHTHGLLEPSKSLWSDQYQTRVRYKTISDDLDEIFKDFPKNQLGLIVATNFFNFKPLEVIQKYILEFNDLLRPGGVVVFTYNNCDLPGPVRNVENAFNTYTPGRLLQRIIEGYGFEVIYSNQSPNGYNWFEFRKPGNYKSLRGGQALAQIKDSRLDN